MNSYAEPGEPPVLRDDATYMDSDRDLEADEMTGLIHTPSPLHEGIVDVLSLKGLVRAVLALRRGEPSTAEEYHRALAKVININGAMARVIEDGRK